MKNRLELFAMGALQVFCIVLNTWLVSHDLMAYAVAAQFAITYIWTLNVKRIAISSNKDRIAHAAGASFGSALVWMLTQILPTL